MDNIFRNRRMNRYKKYLIEAIVGTIISIVCCLATAFGNSYFGAENVSKPIVEKIVIEQQVPKEVPKPIEIAQPESNKPEISEADVKTTTINAINKALKGKLKDKGKVIYEACKSQEPKVNAKLMTAIILVEVGTDCNSSLLNRADNVGGINWYKGCGYPKYGWYMDFSKNGGVDESIKRMAEKLSRYYISEGKKDIVSIGKKWAPPDDPRNGIGGMDNKSWPRNVETHYNKLTEWSGI